MAGNIFYSQVKERIQRETLARARAGHSDRSTKALNFTLGRVGNARAIALHGQILDPAEIRDLKKEDIAGILGGTTVRTGKFLPGGSEPGFLTPDPEMYVKEHNWEQEHYFVDPNGNVSPTYVAHGESENRAKRTPPFITSATVTIGDNATGTLNKASIGVVIPNVTRDLDGMEMVWFRPGREVVLQIEYPKSALLTEQDPAAVVEEYHNFGLFPPKVTGAEEKSQDEAALRLDPDYPRQFDFHGTITSFEYNYQSNGTIEATISLVGASQLLTDMTLVMSGNESVSYDEQQVDQQDAANINPDTFFQTLSKRYDYWYEQQTTIPNEADREPGWDDIYIVMGFNSNFPSHVAAGAPWTRTVNGQNVDTFHRYISLACLLNNLNYEIKEKFFGGGNYDNDSMETWPPDIICTSGDDLCQSNYYEHICSAEPKRILLFSENDNTNTYGIGSNGKPFIWMDRHLDVVGNVSLFNKGNIAEPTAYPSAIFIELNVIKEILDSLNTVQSPKQEAMTSMLATEATQKGAFRVKDFLIGVSKEISKQTAGAVNMNLIIHPDYPNVLLYYDSNFTGLGKHNVTPFKIPMWANSPNGSIVTDFKFAAKIPDSIKSLAFVLNKGGEALSESNMAPYMNFMYSEGDKKQNIIDQYVKLHEDAVEKLEVAKQKFADNPASEEGIRQLRLALQKYLQYPTKTHGLSNKINAPIWPYTISVTLPGINGFRYGDVVTFPGLPTRYYEFGVFNILQITHTIDSSGNWTTKLDCTFRSNIGGGKIEQPS